MRNCSQDVDNGIGVWRYLYFFALWPTMFVIINAANNKVFTFVEWLWYRDAVYYLDSVRRTARMLSFSIFMLPWFQIIFNLLWCNNGGCNAPVSCPS